MKVGAILTACRERAGLSQEKLAELLNKSRSCISKYETNRKLPDVEEFRQILQATNSSEVAIAYLFGFDGLTILNQIMPLFGG